MGKELIGASAARALNESNIVEWHASSSMSSTIAAEGGTCTPSTVPAQMWQGDLRNAMRPREAVRAAHRPGLPPRDCAAEHSPVTVQMRQGVSPVTVQMRQGRRWSISGTCACILRIATVSEHMQMGQWAA